MPGSYCRFCDHRCFVERILPDDSPAKRDMFPHILHMATCAKGKERDREVTGYDADTAINPAAERAKLAREAADCTCVTYCNEHPPTACSLSGEPHQHPDDPCTVHPDAPGDL